METRLAIPLLVISLAALTSCYPYTHMRNMRNRRVPNPRQLYKTQDMLIRGRRGKTTDDREISYLGQNPFQNNPAPSSYGYADPQVPPLRPVDVDPNADQAFHGAAGGFPQPSSQDNFPSSRQQPKPVEPKPVHQQETPVAPLESHAAQAPEAAPSAPDLDQDQPCDRSQCVEPRNCLNITQGDCCQTCAQFGCICEGFHQRYDCAQNGYANGQVPAGESYAVDSGSTICQCPEGGGAIVCSFGDLFSNPGGFGPVSAPKIICPQTPIYCIDTFTNAEGCAECLTVGCVAEDGEKHDGGSRVEKPNCQVCYCPAEGGSLLCTDDQECIERNQGPQQTSLALEATQRVLRDPIQDEGRLQEPQYTGNRYGERPANYVPNSNMDKLGYDTTLLQADWNNFGSAGGGYRQPSSASSSSSSSSASRSQSNGGENVVVPPLVSPDVTGSQKTKGTDADALKPNPASYPRFADDTGYLGYNYNYQQRQYLGYPKYPGYQQGGTSDTQAGPKDGDASQAGLPSSDAQRKLLGNGQLSPYGNYNQQYPGYYNSLNYLGGTPNKQGTNTETDGARDDSADDTNPQSPLGTGVNGFNNNGATGQQNGFQNQYGFYNQRYNPYYGNQYPGAANQYGANRGQFEIGQGQVGTGRQYDQTGTVPEQTGSDGSDLSRATRLTQVDRHYRTGGQGAEGTDADPSSLYRPLDENTGSKDAVPLAERPGAKTPEVKTPNTGSGPADTVVEGGSNTQPHDVGTNNQPAPVAGGEGLTQPNDQSPASDQATGKEEEDGTQEQPLKPASYPNTQQQFQNPYAYPNTGGNAAGLDQATGDLPANHPSLAGVQPQVPPNGPYYGIGKQYPFANQYLYPQPYPYSGVNGFGNQGLPNIPGQGLNGANQGVGLSQTGSNKDGTGVNAQGLTGLGNQGAQGAKTTLNGAGQGATGLANQGIGGFPNRGLTGYPNPLLNQYNQPGYNYPLQPQNSLLVGFQGNQMYPGNQPNFGRGLGMYNPDSSLSGPSPLPFGGSQSMQNQTGQESQGLGGAIVRPHLTQALPSIVPLMSTTYMGPMPSLMRPLPTSAVYKSSNATSFENVLSACCVEGKQWALEHDTCEGIQVTVDTYSQICAVAQEKCCMQAKNQESCQLGIETARSMAACEVPDHRNGQCDRDGFKPCCDCCALGLKAFGLSLSCHMEILGEPCNSAYSECCRKGRLIQNTNDRDGTGDGGSMPQVRPSPVAPVPSSTTQDSGINGRRCLVANDCEHLCHDTQEGIECACREGYKLNRNGHSCDDINECVIGTHTCQVTQICLNTIGGFNCQRRISCGTGYELTDTNTCKDIDECELTLHDCTPNLKCVNLRGSFRCVAKVCGEGYITDATGSCIDIDECRSGDYSCPPRSRCTNTVGSYSCRCREGLVFSKEHNICEDLDECALGISNCQTGTTCINTNGSFTCLEPPTLTCTPGYQPNEAKTSCIDVDECATGSHTCSDGSTCINEIGSFRCQDPIRCGEGTRPSPNKRSCIDINECEEGDTNRCGSGGVCVNLPGTYRCECSRGFRKGNVTGGSETCEDIDECKLPMGSHCKYKCMNTPGSYSCICPDGYTLARYGRTCADVDECADNTDNCSASETCFNTRGGFKCVALVCPKNYAQLSSRDKSSIKCLERKQCTNEPCVRLYTYLHVRLPSIPDLVRPQLLIRLRRGRTAHSFSAQLTQGNEAGKFTLNHDHSLANLSLVQPIQGPWETVLRIDVTETLLNFRRQMKVVIIYVYVSQYPF